MVQRKYLIFLLIFFFSFLTEASSKPQVVQGEIVTEGAIFYSAPHFDSEVLSYLKKGTPVLVSNQRRGLAFFRVRLPNKKIGFVVDIDINFPGKKPPEGVIESSQTFSDPFLDSSEFEKSMESSQIEEHKFIETDWEKRFGLRASSVAYKEKTMGREWRSDLSGFGFYLRGPELWNLAAYLDVGSTFSFQAPVYYERVLGFPAQGAMNWTYVSFSTTSALTPRFHLIYGFGPFLRLSYWDIEAQVLSQKQSYSALDIKFGALVSWGLVYRLQKLGFRFDFQYFWEASSYPQLSMGLEWPF